MIVTQNLGPVKAIHIGATPPSNILMLWHDTNIDEPKYYNTNISQWVSLVVSAGTVTSVSVGNLSPLFTTTVTNSTTAASVAFALSNQLANTVFSGPTTGAAAAPSFRVLVNDDLPVVSISKGGTGATTANTALNNLLPSQTSNGGKFLKTDGTDTSWSLETDIGTVTSVALTVPNIFSIAGSPITTSGTLAVSLATQSANLIFAGPTTGVAATPTFRSLVVADIPDISGTYYLASNPSGYTSNTGTVTSVAMTLPSVLFTTPPSGSPITTSGTFALALVTQTANTIFAGPTTGSAATPTFRSIVAADLPTGTGGAAINGGGTLNYLAKWTPDGNTIGNSQIIDDGTRVGIGIAPSVWYLSIKGISGANMRVIQDGTTSFSTMEAHADYTVTQLRAVVAAEKAGNNWWLDGVAFAKDTVIFGAGNSTANQDIFISVTGQTNPNKIVFGWAASGFYGAQANLDAQTGNFAIGTGITAGSARLHVKGSGTTSATYTAQFHNSTGTNNALVIDDDGRLGIRCLPQNNYLTVAGDTSIGFVGAIVGGYVLYSQSNNTNIFKAKTTLTSGISTFHATGNSGSSNLIVGNDTDGSYGLVQWFGSTRTPAAGYSNQVQASFVFTSIGIGGTQISSEDPAGYIGFHTYSAGGTAERMRVTATGNLAIGVTSATAFVHIAAGTTAKAQLKLDAGVAPSSPNDGDIYYVDTNDRLMFRKNATDAEILSASAVTTEALTSDTSLTITYNGTTYKILARA